MARFVALKMKRLKSGNIEATIDVFDHRFIVWRQRITKRDLKTCVHHAQIVAWKMHIQEPVLIRGPA